MHVGFDVAIELVQADRSFARRVVTAFCSDGVRVTIEALYHAERNCVFDAISPSAYVFLREEPEPLKNALSAPEIRPTQLRRTR